MGATKTNNPPACVRESTAQALLLIMTVLLKNLFTVHFQFDLLKLETNNTRDDILKHAWIIARWTVGYWDFSLTTVATSWVEPHSVWPPSMQYERAPTTLQPPPPTSFKDQHSAYTNCIHITCIKTELQSPDGRNQQYLWHLLFFTQHCSLSQERQSTTNSASITSGQRFCVTLDGGVRANSNHWRKICIWEALQLKWYLTLHLISNPCALDVQSYLP